MYGFDAKDQLKNSASVQAYFELQKPVSLLVPRIPRLEYDINGEIGVPDTKDIYVQVTNEKGSTKDPSVTFQVSVMSELGNIVPQRLRQLAQTITGSPARNLGLNNTVFGKVKQISLSSYLNSMLSAPPPTPSPAPSLEQTDYVEPSYPPSLAISPSRSPAPPLAHFPYPSPCINCDASSPSDGTDPASPSPANSPQHYLPPISKAHAPSPIDTRSPHPSRHCGSEISPTQSESPLPPPQATLVDIAVLKYLQLNLNRLCHLPRLPHH